ncbi:MAG: discoidin domain-containing protein [Fuerstiella sp.]|nr:discoidin domain-containing protein [Planctomycetota bacterium]MCP4858192.1 discoidin domain-containing protein [Fuerstiella sp.]
MDRCRQLSRALCHRGSASRFAAGDVHRRPPAFAALIVPGAAAIAVRRMVSERRRAVICFLGLAAVLIPARFGEGADTKAPAAPEATIHADRPYVVALAPTRTRFVRLVIARTSGNQPCVDELEIYGPDSETNLALASKGAKASASSCLPGYDIHQIHHLNDGHYGNTHSWIAAGVAGEWAQIELPASTEVARVVISRDRDGTHSDRVPVAFEIHVSPDGQKWRTVQRVQAKAAAGQPRGPQYTATYLLPRDPTWDQLRTYAFDCERHTWKRMNAQDHLSPLATDRPAQPGGKEYWGRIARLDALSRTLLQMDEMLERLAAKRLDVTVERQQLAELQHRQAALQSAQSNETATADSLYHTARLAKRRLMFRDPDLEGLQRILFVKRQAYHASHNYSDILDSRFEPGGGVCVLEIPRSGDRLEPSRAMVTTLFDASDGIARDPMASFSGEKIYFAYRPTTSAVAGWQPYWHVMSMNHDGSDAGQLTDGPFHDYYPCPLPDGGLAFITTRVKARFLCWRPQAFALFRMDGDGSNMLPLSFANLSEWSPSVMRDGRILWTRSEYLDKGADFGHTLWATRPDGTHPELVFGNNTPNCYINGREVPGTKEICCTLFSHGGDHNGPIGLIDAAHGPSNTSAVTNITPDVTPHYNMSWPRYECFRDPTPIARDYVLVSHAPADRFGLYVIDRYGNRELLHLDTTIGSMCPTPLRSVTRPPVLASVRDPQLAMANLGQLTLVDVYQGLGDHVKRGDAKYLRVCQEVRADLIEQPDGQCQDDHVAFQDWYATPVHKVSGPNGWPSFVAKATHGLVPIEKDGSATFNVPAGKVLYFELLDGEFNELQRMRSVVQLQAGEKRSCIGCHENRKTTPLPHQALAMQRDPVTPMAPPWGAGSFSYQDVVQPVWDTHCVRCHDAGDKNGINLAGTLDQERVPASYRTLIAGGWLDYFDCHWNLRHHEAKPMTFGTLKSKLWPVLDSGHHDVKLSEPEMRAVKCWTDLNCPLWPDYHLRSTRPAAAALLSN